MSLPRVLEHLTSDDLAADNLDTDYESSGGTRACLAAHLEEPLRLPPSGGSWGGRPRRATLHRRGGARPQKRPPWPR